MLGEEQLEMCYTGPWKNRPFHVYTQYCWLHELESFDARLAALVKKYGLAFDDYWEYRLAGKVKTIVIRRPLWLGRHESGKFAEKWRRYEPGQTKLG